MELQTHPHKVTGGEIDQEEALHSSLSARNKRVLVVGGGDTGSDCVGTSIRQGARSVLQVEILPKPREWKEPSNPEWPWWPRILRTSTSHEEGCERRWSASCTQFSGGYDPWVQKAHFTRVEWKPKGSGGSPAPVEIPGTEWEMEVDLVLLAMGFVHVEHSRLLQDLRVKLDRRGNVAVDSRYMTSEAGIFSAGDAHSGASLVVRAINHGRRAAAHIGEFLSTP